MPEMPNLNDFFKDCFFFAQPKQPQQSAFSAFIQDFPEIAFKDGKMEEFMKMWMTKEGAVVEYEKVKNPFSK